MDIFKSWLVERCIAHRGLHNNEFPENSLGAFQNAINNGYPIELDVHIISDGTLVVFHDDSLSRMTGKDGYLKNLTKSDLENYHLADTEYTIPTFEDVLTLIDGKVPLLIEVKNTNKVGVLETKLLEMLRAYKGEYAIESFNPYVLEWFKNNAPDILRGQLAGFFKGEKLAFIKRFALKRMVLNKIAKPDFIAYEASRLPNRFVRKYKSLPLIAWTVRSQKEYMKVVQYCDNVIFENFEPKI